MKIVLIATALLGAWVHAGACAEEAFDAEHCYVQHCHRDADGTLWCFNTEKSCADVECLTCGEPVDCSYEEADCARAHCTTPQGYGVIVTRKEAELQGPSPSWYRPGGIDGYGADGGSFERQGFHSVYRSWWYDVDSE